MYHILYFYLSVGSWSLWKVWVGFCRYKMVVTIFPGNPSMHITMITCISNQCDRIRLQAFWHKDRDCPICVKKSSKIKLHKFHIIPDFGQILLNVRTMLKILRYLSNVRYLTSYWRLEDSTLCTAIYIKSLKMDGTSKYQGTLFLKKKKNLISTFAFRDNSWHAYVCTTSPQKG